ncbi:MAG: DUF4258 domain-containing protein [Dehalococcoidia bacterium]
MADHVEALRGAILPLHVTTQAARRRLTETDIRGVLDNPGQVLAVAAGRVVAQSLVSLGDPPRSYVLRVFVDIARDPAEVVTAYRSSKIEKYWRPS